MWQRFTESARGTILKAQQEASLDWRAQTVEPQHLLTAILIEEGGPVSDILSKHGLTMRKDLEGEQIKRIDFLPTSEIEEISNEFKVNSQIEARLLLKLHGQSTELKLFSSCQTGAGISGR